MGQPTPFSPTFKDAGISPLVSTAASQQENHGSSLGVLLFVLPIHLWVSSAYSGFSRQSKNTNNRLIGDSKMVLCIGVIKCCFLFCDIIGGHVID